MGSKKYLPSLLAGQSDRMGFFTWELGSNALYGDEILACLFDIALDDIKDGIPIERILERVTNGDRPRIAEAIHAAIVSGRPYEESYDIGHVDGTIVTVAAMGRCFQYSDGTPSHFAGTVVELTQSTRRADRELLRTYCQTAASLAKLNGEQLAERYLSSALGVISGINGPSESK